MKRSIVIFGFSGSGKSTLADALGCTLGLRVIHPSSILRDLITGRVPDLVRSQANTGYWDSQGGMSVFRDRLNTATPIDFTCDVILIELLKEAEACGESVVMDSWTMPWLARNTFNIYLKASLETRVKRVAHRSGITEAEARNVILERDTTTRNLYLDQFDIARDHQVFDVVIDTEHMSQEWVYQQVIDIFKKHYII